MRKPAILIVHNTYFHRGGEDSVVQQELSILQKLGYPVFTSFFDNNAYRKFGWKTLLAPARLFFNLSAFIKIYRTVKKQRIDFVHVHNFNYTASPSVFWAARAAGAKTLFTVHNYRLFCLNGFFFREQRTCMLCHEQQSFKPGIHFRCFQSSRAFSAMFAAAINLHRKWKTWHRKVDRFVVLNPLVHDLLLQSGIPAEKLYLKSNFLNNELTRPRKPFSERQDFYLFVGRISEEKGIRHLVNTFQQNGKKLKLVGSGPLSTWLSQQVTTNIEYYPAIERKELFDWYAACKALVFSSLWPEGYPMALIEAQSVGTPAIAAASAITRKIVGARYGFLYEPDIANDLNQAINNFESLSAQEHEEMSLRIFEHFNKEHTEKQHLDALSELYPFNQDK